MMTTSNICFQRNDSIQHTRHEPLSKRRPSGLKRFHFSRGQKGEDLLAEETGESDFKAGEPACSQRLHLGKRGSVLPFSALPYQLTDGYLQGLAGGLGEGVSAETR